MTVAVSEHGAGARVGAVCRWRFALALREQRNGLKGFYVFIACVALGVAVITGVGALADALRASFERQGEALLGGDVTLVAPHRPAEGEERDWLWRQGRVSEIATYARHGAPRPTARAGAGRGEGRRRRPTRCVGNVVLSDGAVAERCHPQRDLVRPSIRSCSSGWALKVGDRLSLGTAQVPIRATISRARQLTDAAHRRPARAGLARDAATTGLDRAGQPGGLALRAQARRRRGAIGARACIGFREQHQAERCPRAASPCATGAIPPRRCRARSSGCASSSRSSASPRCWSAASASPMRLPPTSTVGARSSRPSRASAPPAGTILGIHLLQVLMIAGIGIVLGIGLGFLIPVALTAMLGDTLPIKADLTVTAAQHPDRGGLRPAGVAAVHALAARARRAGARRRAVPRRGRAGAHPAAAAHHRLTLAAAGCCWRDSPSSRRRRACSRFYYLPRRRRRIRRVPRPRERHRLGAPGACDARAGPSWRWRSATSVRPAASRARSCCRSAPASRCSSPWRWSIAPSSPS